MGLRCLSGNREGVDCAVGSSYFHNIESVGKTFECGFAFTLGGKELKVAIVKEADGADGDIHNIENREDLEAASQVMLSPGRGKGPKLQKMIEDYREKCASLLKDERLRKIIEGNLSTEVSPKAKALGKNWQEYMFEQMPVAAAVTLLSKLQNDVRYAEGEVLHTLVSNIDIKDIRVNKLPAFVIPESKTVIRGDKFSAQIVMAAITLHSSQRYL